MNNKENFKSWLEKENSNKGSLLSRGSINRYINGLFLIDANVFKNYKPGSSIYDISDISELEDFKIFLNKSEWYIDNNISGHNLYSASFNHYFKFFSECKNEGMKISATVKNENSKESNEFSNNKLEVKRARLNDSGVINYCLNELCLLENLCKSCNIDFKKILSNYLGLK